MKLFFAIPMFCLAFAALEGAQADQGHHDLWVSSNRDGLWHARLDTNNGRLSEPTRVVDNGRNRFIVLSPSRQCLYGVSEQSQGSRITAYHLLEGGGLEAASESPGAFTGITHVNVSRDGRLLSVAYYGGGGVSIHALPEDCRIGRTLLANQHEGSSVHHERQRRAHPHWGGFSANGQWAYFTDLGTDHIWVYAVDASAGQASLSHKVRAPGGSGPRHLVFSPDERFAWVSDELTASVSRYTHDPLTGQLAWAASTPAADEAREDWHNVSHLDMAADGRTLYLMSRGFDRVSVFTVDQVSGRLSPLMREPVRGSISRHFVLDPAGDWFVAAGVESNHLATFSVSGDGGLLFTGSMAYVPGPNSIVVK